MTQFLLKAKLFFFFLFFFYYIFYFVFPYSWKLFKNHFLLGIRKEVKMNSIHENKGQKMGCTYWNDVGSKNADRLHLLMQIEWPCSLYCVSTTCLSVTPLSVTVQCLIWHELIEHRNTLLWRDRARWVQLKYIPVATYGIPEGEQ